MLDLITFGPKVTRLAYRKPTGRDALSIDGQTDGHSTVF